MKRWLALAGAMLAAEPVGAETREDEQLWINLTAMGSVKGDLIYFAEVQPRFGDGVSRLDQLLLRPAIGWRISPRVSIYQGFARVISLVDGGRDRAESRPFQQLTWTLPPSRRGEVQLRSRLEQRWRNDGDGMGIRLRQMVRGEYALAASGQGVRALAHAELFVGFNETDWGARKGFDQLRSFVGAEVPVGGKSTVEAGYLNQVIDQGAVTRVNHVASLSLFVRH
jgi:hypothetical protein